MAEEKKVLLSIDDLWVKFRVRGRVLTAIRGVSLDIYENESIAIVGESGSGKSVFTKTFAGMLDSNGFIDKGSIIFSDDELADTHVRLTPVAHRLIARSLQRLNEASKLEARASTRRSWSWRRKSAGRSASAMRREPRRRRSTRTWWPSAPTPST